MSVPAGTPLAVGIGCRRGTSAEAIERALRIALGARALGDVAIVASIDVKRNEAGLLAFCERHRLPLRFFSAAQIARAPRTATSRHAAKHVHVSGVCEPCALLAGGAQALIAPKTIDGDVTVAIAAAREPVSDET